MQGSPLPGHACCTCRRAALIELHEFHALRRVTSDARPWPAGGRLTVCTACGHAQKIADAKWLAEIGEIYRTYAIYHQSDGAEQPIFCGDSEAPQPRSACLDSYLGKMLDLPERLALLDFGCGTGSALRTFSARHRKWTLYGSELSDANLAGLRFIPGFAELFTCPPEEIPLSFDLITLIHSLEHVLDPVATLRALSGRLTGNGHVFVQVPDCSSTPYDLVIADHLSHFSGESLRFAAGQAGCETVEISDTVLRKELSWIGQRGDGGAAPNQLPDPHRSMKRTQHQIEWLAEQGAAAAAIASASPQFGIFGTSISGTWLRGVLGERVRFFVDEDPARIGRRHLGLPICAPGAIPDRADIYVPLIPEVAAAVAKRLARPGIRFHTPGPIDIPQLNQCSRFQ
jgi:SAM-dependent methyltransferase